MIRAQSTVRLVDTRCFWVAGITRFLSIGRWFDSSTVHQFKQNLLPIAPELSFASGSFCYQKTREPIGEPSELVRRLSEIARRRTTPVVIMRVVGWHHVHEMSTGDNRTLYGHSRMRCCRGGKGMRNAAYK